MTSLTEAELELGLILPRLETDFKNAGLNFNEYQNSSDYRKAKLSKQCRERLNELDIQPTPFKFDQIRIYLPELNDVPNDRVSRSYAWMNFVASQHKGWKTVFLDLQKQKSERDSEKRKEATRANFRPIPESLSKTVMDYSVRGINHEWIEYLLMNKKISPELREMVVCQLLGITHLGETVNGFDGVASDGRPIEIKTEQTLTGESHYKLQGKHLFSCVTYDTMVEKIKKNPIMSHAGFIDGKVAFVVTFMLGDMFHDNLLRCNQPGSKNRTYYLKDWSHLPFRLQYRNDDLIDHPGFTARLRTLLKDSSVWTGIKKRT